MALVYEFYKEAYKEYKETFQLLGGLKILLYVYITRPSLNRKVFFIYLPAYAKAMADESAVALAKADNNKPVKTLKFHVASPTIKRYRCGFGHAL